MRKIMAEEKIPQPLFVLQQTPTATVPPEQLYSIIGENGIARLTAAFYRQIPGDDILAPMYPEDDLQASEERLRDFLVFRFGGSQRYIEQRGHPRLRMRHALFPIDQRARDRWVACMDRALDQMSFPDHASTALRAFFREVATFLINRDIPSQDA
jgi:hemoglobin